jgi:hypothetical protein
VWLNYRASDIGCGNDITVNPLVRLPAFYDGSLMQGRIRCGYEWLRSNDPAVFQSLGQVVTNETHYFSPDGFDAWYNQFSSGSKVQFEWRGPCGDPGNGYLKFYVVPCSFVASTFPGGILFESPGCGTTIRQTSLNSGQMRVEATTGGMHASAVVTSTGVVTVTEGDFRAIQIATGELRRAQQFNRVANKPGAPASPACVLAGAAALSSTGWVVAACLIPEPLEPIACVTSIAGTLIATAGFNLACR